MSMSRGKKIAGWSVASLVALIALCLTILLAFDWNRAKPWLNARVSDAIGRPFAINGDLRLAWDKAPLAVMGWQRWIPWPHLSAQDVTIANPEWATVGRHMAEVGRLDFSLNPLALLGKNIVVPSLRIESPDITLQRNADGDNNWTFKQSGDQPSAWKLELQELVLEDGNVRLLDAVKRADVKASFGSLPETQNGPYRIGWKMTGKFNGAAVSGTGKLGGILSLRDASAQSPPYPIQADVKVGKTGIAVEGTITNPRALAALDMRLKVSGASMAQLFPLTGVLLPETPPYMTAGHLIGKLDRDGGIWTYEKFSGRVGSSDLAGTLEFHAKKPRPLLKGSVVSNLLQLKDLAPVVGADSNASKANRGAQPNQPKTKLLPVEVFKTDRWRKVDADVKFTGRKIIRDESLPIDDLTTNLRMDDGVLTLTPLNFGVAGGDLRSTIKLDGRGDVIKAEMKIAARRLKLKQLFPSIKDMQESLGEANGDASLSATGNSIAGLLGASNGEIKLVVRDGTISKLLVEKIGLNLGNIVLTKLFGDKQIRINCLASDFSVANGIMQPRIFLVDTEESVVNVTGRISLAQEELGLTINPRSKGLRLISLRAPFYVTGSFVKPAVAVDTGVLALKAGSAVVLALAAPVATALLPLANLGRNEDSPCAQLLAEASEKPVAPRPGKTYKEKAAR